MINLWCPFRKGLQDVLCIFYLPRAVLHQLGAQALQKCFLIRCRVDLLTPPSWWGKIYPFVKVLLFTLPAVLGSPGQAGRCQSCHSRHSSALRRWCPSPDAMDKPQHLLLPCWATSHAQNTELTNKKTHNLHTPDSVLPFLLCLFPPWFN